MEPVRPTTVSEWMQRWQARREYEKRIRCRLDEVVRVKEFEEVEKVRVGGSSVFIDENHELEVDPVRVGSAKEKAGEQKEGERAEERPRDYEIKL